jgi:L-ascorbate metabolism protein UlaG (beta-lactamase superfamily)
MKSKLKIAMMVVTVVLIVLVAGGGAFLSQPKFGKLPSGKVMERINKSPHFKDGKFQNLENTPDLTEGVTYYSVMKEFLFTEKVRNKPVDSLPARKVDLKNLPFDAQVLVWFGHSSCFIKTDGKTILVDPVFSGSASPIKATTRSYRGSDVYAVEDLPSIDYLFLSHDHWDHVDYETLLKLKSKVKKVVVGLGVGVHLEHWGYNPTIITETDWGDKTTLDSGFVVTTTTARHFSGRGLTRNKSLWAAYALQTPSLKIYIGGDSGYGTHFAKIGEELGPFDLVLLECGQYDKSWKYIHMMPEEVVKAAIDLKAKSLMPVHWSKFSLGNHAWDDPILRVTKEAALQQMPIVHPFIGELVTIKDTAQGENWWEKVK